MYVDWPFGITEGLSLKGGIYDNSPMYPTLQAVLDITNGGYTRLFTISTENVGDGVYTEFNNDNLPYE